MKPDKDTPTEYIAFDIKQAQGSEEQQRIALSRTDLYELFNAHSERCEAIGDKASITNGCQGLADLQKENDEVHARLQEKLKGAARNSAK